MKYIYLFAFVLLGAEAHSMPSQCPPSYTALASRRGPRQLSREEIIAARRRLSGGEKSGPRQLSPEEVIARDRRAKESIAAMPEEIKEMKESSVASGLSRTREGLGSRLEKEGYTQISPPGTKMPAALRAKQPASLTNHQVVVKVTPRKMNGLGQWTHLSRAQREPIILRGRVIKQDGKTLTIVDKDGRAFEVGGLFRTEALYIKE